MQYQIKYLKQGAPKKDPNSYPDIKSAKIAAYSVKGYEGTTEVWIEDSVGNIIIPPAEIMKDGK